jgi:pyruvate dehydrogenase E2 component (dihydrolipoamide acetyltransferase)
MPRLSDTMTEGVVEKWLKAEGDEVAKGEPIAEIETDKVTVELEAPADGRLLRLLVAEGDEVAPGGILALVGPEGAELEETVVAGAPPVIEARPVAAAPVRPTAAAASSRICATPLARRLAAETGVGLASVGAGSGPNGRILRHDVERAARG